MNSWKRFQQYYREFGDGPVSIALDLSRALIPPKFWKSADTAQKTAVALGRMRALEAGAIANPDPTEMRMVGHYWLRAPELAPAPEITAAIKDNVAAIEAFAACVHSGEIRGGAGEPFTNVLCIGIGGSALGPQFVGQALGSAATDKARLFFLDNTDPDGMDAVFAQIGDANLARTLAVIISKSGTTYETSNGMLEAKARYEKAGLVFGKHAVAITDLVSKKKNAETGAEEFASALKRFADAEGFLAQFPMWDWVGGRTSQLAAVGLLPAALQGLDIRGLLAGAAAMDRLTRPVEGADAAANPALLLAQSWFSLTRGRGARDMVILPYKDRLQLFARYLQQLIMESLGKGEDLDGKPVEQGIAVYGNKGSTDQHAFVQQLREGVDNFFVTFIEVLRDREGDSIEVQPKKYPGVTSGDFLAGFLLGTREALYEKKRPTITLTVPAVTAPVVGALIALFERAVGYYASFVNINAYNQPGVQAGKLAAGKVLEIQTRVAALLASKPGKAFSVKKIAKKLALEDQSEIVFKVCEHLAANPAKHIAKQKAAPFYNAVFNHI